MRFLEGLPQAPEDIRVVLGRGEVAGVDFQGVERIGQHGSPCGLRHPPPSRPEAAVLHRPPAGPMDQALEGGLSPGPLPQLPELRVGPALPPLSLGGPAVLGGGVGVGGCDVVVGTGGGGGPEGFLVVLSRAPPLPAHPHGTGLRGIPLARHGHRSPRPRHTHPRPLLRPRPQARPGTVVAALDPHAALGAAKVGPGRALTRGPGPSAPQGVGGELPPPAGGGVDAAGRMVSHAGRCAPPPGSPPPQPPRAPGPPVCPQAPAGDPPGDTARRHSPVGHHPKPSPAQTHPLTTPQVSAHRHRRHPQHPRSPAHHRTRRA